MLILLLLVLTLFTWMIKVLVEAAVGFKDIRVLLNVHFLSLLYFGIL